MKRLLSFSFLLAFLLAGGSGGLLRAQETSAGDFMLRLETRNGQTYDIRMAKFERISCTSQQMSVYYGNGELVESESYYGEGTTVITIDAEDGARISFQNIPATGIKTVDDSKATQTVQIKMVSGDAIHVSGLREGDRVAVYTLGGQKAGAQIRRSGNEADVNLLSLPRGTYLVSVNGSTTLKVMKR